MTIIMYKILLLYDMLYIILYNIVCQLYFNKNIKTTTNLLFFLIPNCTSDQWPTHSDTYFSF